MPEKTRIILVDDEPEILEMLQGLLVSEGYVVHCALNGADAIELFKREGAHLVVTDIRMPGMDGFEVLRSIKALDKTVEVIILTGHASVSTAISALKDEGAFDFLTKPLDRLDEFITTIERALAHRNLIIENASLFKELRQQKIDLETYNKELCQTKRALEVSRYRYQDLYDQAPVGYLNVNGHGLIEETNQTAANLFGIAKSKMYYKRIIDFIMPEDRATFKITYANFSNNIPCAVDIRMRRSDGSVFNAHLESLAVLKGDGSIDQVRITIYDITSQKEIELALKESEQRYRNFVQNFKGIAFQIEADGSPVFYHGAVEETTGYNESKLMRNRPGWEVLIHPEELELVRSRRRILCTSGECNTTHEYRIQHRNRQWKWVREHIQSLYDPNQQGYILHGVIFDISDQKNLQAQYIESRKLDAIATMAAGIAHQFNNSLAGLMGNLELLQMDVDPKSKTTKYIDPMMSLIQGMTGLTRQMLAYARGGKYMPSQISIHKLVHECMNLLEHRLAEKYELNLQLNADMDIILADSTQMQMVLISVVENAIEAMGEGGCIHIHSRSVEMNKETIRGGGTCAAGRYLCLSIKDNGCGMSQSIAEKIFDPFFTTKFIGRGLGLSAAYGIIVNHNGWMDVDTAIDKGTEIKIYLPLLESLKVIPHEPDHGPATKGNATILVVEDECIVMNAIHELLERLSYRVLEAATGHTALEVLKTHREHIDVVLLDVQLPDIMSEDLFNKMLDIRPDLKVIVCSGYNQDGPAEKLLAAGAKSFLQKPFSVTRLTAELKTVIEHDKGLEKIHFKVLS